MEYFAGIDISLRSCALCIVDGKGIVLLERELPCEVSDIAACLGAFPNPIERVGFEAGTMSQHLCHSLPLELIATQGGLVATHRKGAPRTAAVSSLWTNKERPISADVRHP
jgi:hypothetical protein